MRRTLPVCFSAFSGRCERGPRLLLILNSNREPEVNRRSILLLCIADLEYSGLMFSKTLFPKYCTDCTERDSTRGYYPNAYPNVHSPSVRLADSNRVLRHEQLTWSN